MRIESAITLIEQLIYKSEWKFTARDHSNRFEGTVRLRIDYPARNSNRDQAAEGYPEEIMTYASFPITVEDCESEIMLYGRVLGAIVDIETHEAREFLRTPGTHEAPFHPHRLEGMKNWENVQGNIVMPGNSGDLLFGLA